MEYMEQQRQQQIEAGLSNAEQCYARIAELEEQNAALAAQFEAFGTLINEVTNGEGAEAIACDGQISGYVVGYDWLNKVGAAIELPPQHHLRQVRADAGRDAIKAVLSLPTFTAKDGSWLIKAIAWDKVLPFANQYHASILAGKE